MEANMRNTVILTAAFVLAGFGAGISLKEATAAPIPKVEVTQGSSLTENVTLRRDRRGRAMVPVAPRGSAVVAPTTRTVIVTRPASCGEFHYWDGTACVDARYTDRHFN